MSIIRSIDKLSESRLITVWEFAKECDKAEIELEKLMKRAGLPSPAEDNFKMKYIFGRGREAFHEQDGWTTMYETKLSIEEWRSINQEVSTKFLLD